MEERRTSN